MKYGFCLAAAIAAFCFGVGVTYASGPVAVFALVDNVRFEPDADHPQRIEITGVFILSSVPKGCGSPSNPCATTYSAPVKGSLYYSLATAREPQTAAREWADLKAVAGTRQVVGFGTGWAPNDARVYKTGEKLAEPQPWPENNTGVMKVNADRSEAKALLEYKGQ